MEGAELDSWPGQQPEELLEYCMKKQQVLIPKVEDIQVQSCKIRT